MSSKDIPITLEDMSPMATAPKKKEKKLVLNRDKDWFKLWFSCPSGGGGGGGAPKKKRF